MYIKDFIGNDDKVLSREDFQHKFNLQNVRFMTYCGIITQIHKWIKRDVNKTYINAVYEININNSIFKIDNHFINVKKFKCKDYCNAFIHRITSVPTVITYWQSLGVPNTNQILTSLQIYRKTVK